jgi:dihydroorotate dehydrogenase
MFVQFFFKFFKYFCSKIFQKKVDGVIISNTTIKRPDYLTNKNKNETGGLSGRPLKNVSNDLIKKMFLLTNGLKLKI